MTRMPKVTLLTAVSSVSVLIVLLAILMYVSAVLILVGQSVSNSATLKTAIELRKNDPGQSAFLASKQKQAIKSMPLKEVFSSAELYASWVIIYFTGPLFALLCLGFVTMVFVEFRLTHRSPSIYADTIK